MNGLPFLKTPDVKIPIPDPSYLEKFPIPNESKRESKYEREYDAYCKWAALPREQRSPKKIIDFERKWGLPRTTTDDFRRREDFQQKRLGYFWDWMMDQFPDVVHAIYKRAIKNSPSDARVYAELIAKRLDVEKPKITVSPMVLIGVPQEKIDNLFIPKGFQDAQIITPKDE